MHGDVAVGLEPAVQLLVGLHPVLGQRHPAARADRQPPDGSGRLLGNRQRDTLTVSDHDHLGLPLDGQQIARCHPEGGSQPVQGGDRRRSRTALQLGQKRLTDSDMTRKRPHRQPCRLAPRPDSLTDGALHRIALRTSLR